MEYITLALLIIIVILLLLLIKSQNDSKSSKDIVKKVEGIIENSSKHSDDLNLRTLNQFSKGIDNQMLSINNSIMNLKQDNFNSLNAIQNLVSQKLTDIQANNEKHLTQMQKTVDEKLESTLQSRIAESFKIVSDQLEQVYKGIGEMRNLATNVTDLKKVLTQVKTRGNFGELQLKNILDEFLSYEQYDTNAITKPGTNNRVEFAIKLPADNNNKFIYLPIDSKFPADTYNQLLDAYDSTENTKENVAAAQKNLEYRIKQEAKDICDKYIDVPNTTNFGILYLPTEGLYAEVVKLDLFETLQRKYNVTIAGPTTITALLNSLQMGFRTLAIQKRSSEVFEILSATKLEFEKFETVLEASQKQLRLASDNLDKLIGVRTRAINNKLKNIQKLPLSEETKAKELLDLE